jgi:hypothetical protein
MFYFSRNKYEIFLNISMNFFDDFFGNWTEITFYKQTDRQTILRMPYALSRVAKLQSISATFVTLYVNSHVE